jgi:hypothetical protein
MKYLRCTTSAAANNGLSTTITPPCSAASFEVNSEPYTGARPSVRLCVGPELARCVHFYSAPLYIFLVALLLLNACPRWGRRKPSYAEGLAAGAGGDNFRNLRQRRCESTATDSNWL